MYLKRIQLESCGPILDLDITPPFESGKPQPVILVGGNGSGKSILLSYIVLGLQMAKRTAYPNAHKADSDRIYKLCSPEYIRVGHRYYFARVDYEYDLGYSELQLRSQKRTYYGVPPEGILGSEAESLWATMNSNEAAHVDSSRLTNRDTVLEAFSRNCVLYFPSDRFENPAWLDESNLRFRASHMDIPNTAERSARKIVNVSPLKANQKWIYDVFMDSVQRVLEKGAKATLHRPEILFHAAMDIINTVIDHDPVLKIRIGHRHNRKVGLGDGQSIVVPNIFQLSSGEVSLLSLFLSILQDFDLANVPISSAEGVRGIVIVDEIDLHLHTRHQYEVLPKLIKKFPNVQFIVTTHSPLFVLGLSRELGEGDFAVYDMPDGIEIGPEDFSEIGEAYKAFAVSDQHIREIRDAVAKSQKPIVFVDGKHDVKYIHTAASLLGYEELIERVEIRGAGGNSNLKRVWNDRQLFNIRRDNPVIILHDPECEQASVQEGNVFRATISKNEKSPVDKGIENLFNRETLEIALKHKRAFIDIRSAHEYTVRGETKEAKEEWSVNTGEKKNLRNWLCENCGADDFENFRGVLELIKTNLPAPNNDNQESP